MLQTFRHANLDANPNVWINFVRHSVSPTTHETTITVERMLLLHCVMEGLSINVGEVMLKSIKYCASRFQGKLFLPGVVNRLCIQAGVQQYEEDEIVEEGENKHTIDVRSVARMQAEKPGRGGGNGDLFVLINCLLDQNNNVMDGLMEQRREFLKEVEDLKTKMVEELKNETKEMKQDLQALKVEFARGNDLKKKGVANKQKKMAARIKALRAQVQKLKKEKAAVVAAASKPTSED